LTQSANRIFFPISCALVRQANSVVPMAI
jgi:hypothetical protein